MKRGIDITEIVSPSQVLTSEELILRLTKRGLGETAARQFISRAARKGLIWRSKLELSNRSRLFAHHQFVGKNSFLQQSEKILENKRPGISRCIRMLMKDSVLSRIRAQKLLSTPVDGYRNRRFPDYESEIAALIDMWCCEQVEEGRPTECLAFRRNAGSNKFAALIKQSYKSLQTERVLNRIVTEQLRNQNLLSWNGVTSPDCTSDHVSFAGFPFSSVGFSFLEPLKQWKKGNSKPKPTFVVIDVVPYRCREEDVEGFGARMERARSSTKEKSKFLGILAAEAFDENAFNKAKSEGLMTINLRQYLGDSTLEIVRKLGVQLEKFSIEDESDSDTDDVGWLSEMLRDFKTNPYVVSLRSVGFEIMCSLILRAKGYEGVKMGTNVPFGSGNVTRDVDVHGEQEGGDTLFIIECKAESGMKELSADDVKKFFTETVPAAVTHLGRPGGPNKCHAQIWTSGSVGSEAKKKLSELKLRQNVEPKLLGNQDIKDIVPSGIKKCNEFLDALSAGDNELS